MRGFLRCVVCGIEHLDTEFAPRTWTRYANRYSVPRSRTCRTCERRATMRRRLERVSHTLKTTGKRAKDAL